MPTMSYVSFELSADLAFLVAVPARRLEPVKERLDAVGIDAVAVKTRRDPRDEFELLVEAKRAERLDSQKHRRHWAQDCDFVGVEQRSLDQFELSLDGEPSRTRGDYRTELGRRINGYRLPSAKSLPRVHAYACPRMQCVVRWSGS
jgi:hypothetical protein